MIAQDLLVQRATEGLDPGQLDELEQLGGGADASFDLAVAMIDVAMCPAEAMPDAVADRVLAAALSRGRKPAPLTAPALPAIAASMTIRAIPEAHAVRPGSRRRRLAYPLVTAFAAALVGGLAIGRVSRPSPPPTPASSALAPSNDDIVAQWTGPGITGSIRWSTARQLGQLEIHGLPINDPRRERFQLWIVDRDRDRRYPVDGGLFDVGGRDVSFGFQAHVRVATPSEFFITREAPDGAVVSERADVVARSLVTR